jgi:hypothetical protein
MFLAKKVFLGIRMTHEKKLGGTRSINSQNFTPVSSETPFGRTQYM